MHCGFLDRFLYVVSNQYELYQERTGRKKDNEGEKIFTKTNAS